MSDKDQPLKAEVVDDKLVISIGVGTLAWAAKKKNGGPVPNKYKIACKQQWARDVANALEHDDEVGNTPLTELLDNAMQSAMDRGSTGLRY